MENKEYLSLGILVSITVAMIIPTLSVYGEIQCGTGYYAMHDQCHELPDLAPKLPDDLGFYEPWSSDSFGNPKISFNTDETVYITALLDNQGEQTYNYTVSIRYLRAEIGEWSQWNFAKSQINAGDVATVTLPFLKADQVKDTQIQIQLSDDWGIIYTYNYIPQVSIESKATQQQKILFPFVDPEKDPQYYLDRYYNEPIYKEWFDTNYPGHTIEEAVGLPQSQENKPIPEWVKGIFAWYSQGQIGDDELIQALQFLIKDGIIQI